MALLCLFIAVQSAFADNPVPPTFKEGLVYNGTQQVLVADIGKGGSSNEEFIFFDASKNAWGNALDDLPREQLPGEYTVRYCLSETGTKKCKFQEETHKVTIAEYMPPKEKSGLVYNGSKQTLVIPGTALNGDVYYYNNPYWPAEATDKWTTTPTEATEPGTYVVEYYLAVKGTRPSNDITGKFTKSITIAPRGSYNPSGNSSGDSGSSSNHSSSAPSSFYTIGDGYGLFFENKSLPATGFPTRISMPLSLKPDTVWYEDLAMRIQIPSINVDVELTGVPELGNTWAVEWLDDKAGILSGSAMPGEGYTLVAAHNHLNTQEIGPFGFLFDLDNNDRIFVNMPDGGLKIYSVYANELLEPNDFRQMAAISENEDGSLILITCENELIDGSYQNRRVVFAKLMN